MRIFCYRAGRALQIIALAVMPFSIWVGHLGHDERGAITIFLSSIFIFFSGYLLTRLASR